MWRIPSAFYVAISLLAVLVGVLCIIIALATALADHQILALSTTYVQIGVASFLVAIWFAVIALLCELREHWTKEI